MRDADFIPGHPDYPGFMEHWRLVLSERLHKKGLSESEWPKVVAKWCINESAHAWKTRNPKTDWVAPPKDRPGDHPELWVTKMNGRPVDW